MVKKITLSLVVLGLPGALLSFAATLDQEELPSGWGDVARSVSALRERIVAQAREVASLASAIKSRRGVRAKARLAADDTAFPFRGVVLDLDLSELFQRRDAEETARQILALLRLAGEAGWCEVDGRLGRSRVQSVEPVVEALIEAAAQHNLFLDPERQVDARFDDDAEVEAPPPRTHKTPPVNEPKKTGPASPPREENSPPKKRKAKAKQTRQGSFGGLPDDEPPSTVVSPGGLGEEELFFLSYARLLWPCEGAAIKVAYRQVVKAVHPDKHAGDPAAHHRFVLLQKGYEGLLRRLEA